MEFTEGQRTSCRGHKLYTVEYWPPAGQQAKAVLVFHPGIGEHVGRYKEFFGTLASAGVAAFAADPLGHGKSEGARAFIENFDDLVTDFAAFADHAKQQAEARCAPAPPPPMFIGGHSLGGLVAALTCLRDQGRWAGLLVLSPALDMEWTLSLRLQAVVGSLLSRLVPRARIVKVVRPEDMNPDPVRVQEYINDPLNTVGPMAARTAHEGMRAFTHLRTRWAEFTLPIYAHHGDADKCTSCSGTKRFVEAAGSRDKTFRCIPGGYHEVMLSPEREQVIAGLLDWILQRSAPAQKL